MNMDGAAYIKGQVMFFGANQLIMTGSADIIGTILADKGSTLSPQVGPGVPPLPSIQYVDLSEALSSISATETMAKTLAPNMSWTAGSQILNLTQVTLTSTGAQNVVVISTDLTMDNVGVLNLNGGPNDQFIFYVKGNLNLQGKATINLNGVSASNVLFIVGKNLNIINSATGQGTFIVDQDVSFDGDTTLSGSIFARGNMYVSGSSGPNITPSIFCTK